MIKHKFIKKTKEDAINEATITLQETIDNLIIIEKETKSSLFSGKKVEIEVIETREVIDFIKKTIQTLLKDLGFSANIEVKKVNDVPNYIIYSDNDSLLIGKNGKNLQALSLIIAQIVKKEIGEPFRFIIDINDYKEKKDHHIEFLARTTAKEVAKTKIEAKLDSMNSYERRLVHNAASKITGVVTKSEGEEPNRYVVIKPKED